MSVQVRPASDPVIHLVCELCDDSADTALRNSSRAERLRNAALSGFCYALSLSAQDPETMRRVMLHMGFTPETHLTDPVRLAERFREALDEARGGATP